MGTSKGSAAFVSTFDLDYLPLLSFSLIEGALLGNGFVTVHISVDLFSSWIAVTETLFAWRLLCPHFCSLARNGGHSLLASNRKLDGSAGMMLCVRWSNTMYSPGDSTIRSSMRIFADSRSFAASNQRKLPSGF